MAQLLLTEIVIYIRVCAMYTTSRRIHRYLLVILIAATLGSTTIIGVVGSRSKGKLYGFDTARFSCRCGRAQVLHLRILADVVAR